MVGGTRRTQVLTMALWVRLQHVHLAIGSQGLRGSTNRGGWDWPFLFSKLIVSSRIAGPLLTFAPLPMKGFRNRLSKSADQAKCGISREYVEPVFCLFPAGAFVNTQSIPPVHQSSMRGRWVFTQNSSYLA